MIRKDWNDQIFRTEKEKNKAIINKVIECSKNAQPVLIGTTSIQKSEVYSQLLKDKGIKHSVLNAKQHGHQIENGKMMFIYQAHQAFTIWHKILPNINDETIKLLEQ